MSKKTTVLMILDGFGINDKTEGNAIKMAKKPVIDNILNTYPCVKGYASGLSVGLPDGQMGNSEVGHLNMGAGRIIYQDLTKITKAIEDGDFFNNEALCDAVKNCKDNNSDLHLYGLLSTGGVHSHLDHVYALLKLAKDNGLENVYVHCFLDGRDTPPTSAKGFIATLEEKMAEIGVGKVATISGRYYAMDRDNRWDRVEKAYNAMVLGEGNTASSAEECMTKTYAEGVNDEFVVPTVILNDGKPTATIKENDSIIFFNFRPDRAREITRSFCDVEFSGFERAKGYFPVKYVCFTDYDVTIENKEVAFKKEKIVNTLGEYLSSLGKTQARIAETEKYAHVTFFFNGGVEEPNPGEDRILVPSPKVATYDLQPEMSAPQVTEKLVEAIESGKYDVIIINYANPDMVGHTGVIPAAVKAIETIDSCVGKVMDSLLKVDGQMFMCADHGNSDQLIDYSTGKPFTAHTTNPVPFVLVNCHKAKGLMEDGKLCDIAPTLLDMMDIPKPDEMTGHSLLIK
ncbi:MAG: 2,3-bisphosphoglycerate-independent phosphoglycerate mutase [Lachnospirales bacterium]